MFIHPRSPHLPIIFPDNIERLIHAKRLAKFGHEILTVNVSQNYYNSIPRDFNRMDMVIQVLVRKDKKTSGFTIGFFEWEITELSVSKAIDYLGNLEIDLDLDLEVPTVSITEIVGDNI